jgi:hypothetical protein
VTSTKGSRDNCINETTAEHQKELIEKIINENNK